MERVVRVVEGQGERLGFRTSEMVAGFRGKSKHLCLYRNAMSIFDQHYRLWSLFTFEWISYNFLT